MELFQEYVHNQEGNKMNGLRYIRTRCNLSISELAEQLGVTRQAICSWETGKKVVPEKRKAQLAFFFWA